MNDTAKVIGAIVLIGLGVFFFRSGSAKIEQSQDFPDGTHWICLACKAEFAKSLDEVGGPSSQHRESEGSTIGRHEIEARRCHDELGETCSSYLFRPVYRDHAELHHRRP